MDLNAVITSVILSVSSAGVITALIEWVRNKDKDKATAKLTDIQALQAQLAYVEGVAEYLQRHNDNLQKDYDQLDTRYRDVRNRLSEVEEELDKVSRTAAQAQAECENLAIKLRSLMGEFKHD